jgi:hypothetical protein
MRGPSRESELVERPLTAPRLGFPKCRVALSPQSRIRSGEGELRKAAVAVLVFLA